MLITHNRMYIHHQRIQEERRQREVNNCIKVSTRKENLFINPSMFSYSLVEIHGIVKIIISISQINFSNNWYHIMVMIL